MRECEQIGEKLDAYGDGELRGLARWRVARHLGRCSRCRSELEGLARLRAWIRDAEGEHEPPSLWASIEPRLTALDAAAGCEESAPARPRLGWITPVLVGGAAAVGVAVWLGGLEAIPAPPRAASVQALYSHGRPVVVLDGEEDATIIWLMDEGAERGSREDPGARA
jgi:anti-sigma factor RsiW